MIAKLVRRQSTELQNMEQTQKHIMAEPHL